MHTSEEELLSSVEEAVFGLGVGHGVEAADANDAPNRVAAAVVGVRVCPEDAAQIRLQPELVRCLSLLASLVNAVALDGARDRHVHAHVQA